MADVGFWQGMATELSGKGHLRLILQPAIALILGIRLGVSDARKGHEPFLWRLFLRKNRRVLLKEALKDILVPLALAIVLDCILQMYTLHRIRPLAALIVGGLLIALPFSVARALTNRIVTRRRRPSGGGHEALRPA